MDENTSGSTYNQYITPEKLSRNEKFLLTAMGCMSLMTLYKIRVQHKHLTQMLDLAGSALTQLAAASKKA